MIEDATSVEAQELKNRQMWQMLREMSRILLAGGSEASVYEMGRRDGRFSLNGKTPNPFGSNNHMADDWQKGFDDAWRNHG